jgi:hypothetical protein
MQAVEKLAKTELNVTVFTCQDKRRNRASSSIKTLENGRRSVSFVGPT